MNKKLVIGISGKIGSGKDSAAIEIAKIAKLYGLKTDKHAFADKLREMISNLIEYEIPIVPNTEFANIVRNYTQEDKNKYFPEWGMTIGKMLQIGGTECMRDHFHKSTWVLSCLARINKSNSDIIVVPDVRFINEADAIIDAGGILIRLDGDPMQVRANSNRDLNHPSETELDNYEHFNYYINTTPSIDELNVALTCILKQELQLPNLQKTRPKFNWFKLKRNKK